MDKNKYAPKDYERKATQTFLTFVLGLVLLGGLILYLFMPSTDSRDLSANPQEEEAILAVNDEKTEDPLPSEDAEYNALKEEAPIAKETKTPEPEVKKVVEKKENKNISKEVTAKKTSIDETQALVLVDEMATPKSGFEAFYRYIRENMAYPEEAIKQGIEGKVVLEFVVDKEGNLHNMRVKKSLGHGCDEVAMRVVKEGEKWKPAKNKGELVLQKITLPISFKLSSEK